MQTGYRIVVSALGWFAIILQYSLIANTRSGPDLAAWTINYFSFFTTIGNILVALAMTLPWLAPRLRLGRWFLRPSVRTVIVAYIIVVGVVYHVMLRNLYNPQGWRLACVIILHYVIPPLFVLDWLAFVQKRDLSWKILFGALALPVFYVAWTLAHGAVTGFYPYPFINIPKIGWMAAVRNVAGISLAFLLCAYLLVALDRRLGRLSLPTS